MRVSVILPDIVAGPSYERLIRFAAARSLSFAVVQQEALPPGPRSVAFGASLEHHLISREKVLAWPGSSGLTRAHTESRFRIDDASIRILLDTTDDLWDWVNPGLPEDLHFYGSDDRVVLGSTAQHHDAWVECPFDEVDEVRAIFGSPLRYEIWTWPPDERSVEVESRGLWFTDRASGHRCWITGAAHTFPGRISAYDPVDRIEFTTSRWQMTAESPHSRAWIDGFLAPGEPYSRTAESGPRYDRLVRMTSLYYEIGDLRLAADVLEGRFADSADDQFVSIDDAADRLGVATHRILMDELLPALFSYPALEWVVRRAELDDLLARKQR